MIRSVRKEDFEEIRSIYDRYYKEEFPFPDFLEYLCAFVVTDNNDRIITAGGVRPIAEILLVTEKSFGTMTRHRAFREILTASKFVALRSGFHNLNAIINNDSKWSGILTRLKYDKFERSEILQLEL